jgi:hypothetical protein
MEGNGKASAISSAFVYFSVELCALYLHTQIFSFYFSHLVRNKSLLILLILIIVLHVISTYTVQPNLKYQFFYGGHNCAITLSAVYGK